MRTLAWLLALALIACDQHVPSPPLILDGSPIGGDGGSSADTGLFEPDSGLLPPSDGGAVVGRPDGGPAPGDSGAPVDQDAGTVVIVRDSGAPSPQDAGVVVPEDDHGNSLNQATELGDRRRESGRIDYDGDTDVFSFVTGRAGVYQIFTTGRSDTRCTLFSAAAQPLAQDDDGGDGWNCRIEIQLRANELHFVRVRLWGGDVTGDYELHIVDPPPPPPVCGDARVEGDEQCDDGNDADDDACIECRPARCGDGVVRRDLEPGDPGHEFCDDGNQDSGDTCTNDCAIPRCGDGHLWRGVEECDDGNEEDGDGCRLNCRVARCGDGVIFEGVETCDDGNDRSGDGCDARCQLERTPEGCEAVPGRGRATIACNDPRRTWEGAEAFCQDWGGHLISVANEADQQRLAGYGWRMGDLWIGYNDREEEGEWVWAGRASSFRRWTNGEPNNSGNNEDCGHLWRQGWWAWNDARCAATLAFFCEH